MAATIDVNPANQAFPPPPGGSQALPIPSAVAVASLPAIQPSFSQGTAQAAQPNVNVATQNNVLFPVQDVIVTESGNYATNNTSADVQSFKIAANVTPPGTTDVYQLTLTDLNGKAISLSSYGVDFTELFASFPSAASAKSPENVPSRPITAYNDPNTIVVEVQDSFGNNLPSPSAGQTVQIGIVRQGASNIVSQSMGEVDVFISPAAPAAVTVPSSGPTPMGNIFPNNPGLPFIGSGQGAPPFIGTFEVENQALIGRGLPANVFV